MRTYTPHAGIWIGDACLEAIEMAKQTGEAVEFEFNGIKAVATGDSNPDDVCRAWGESSRQHRQAANAPKAAELRAAARTIADKFPFAASFLRSKADDLME